MGWRAIHDDVPQSDSLNLLTDFAERLYWRMLAVSDACGRGPGSIPKLASLCIPRLAKPGEDITSALEELIAVGRIRLYCTKGVWAYQLLDFDERQLPALVRRSRTSKFPAPPPESEAIPQLSLVPPEISAGSPLREKTRGDQRKTLPDEPARESSNRNPDELWDELVRVIGTSPQTKTERGRWNAAAKELREAQATPADVRARAKVFRQRYPAATLTATALSANWGALAPRRQTAPPCPSCGIGGGHHTDDCQVVQAFTDRDVEHVAQMIEEHRP